MIEVLSIPPLATIQDLGRDGFWKQGLGRAGAMDRLGHSIANLMLNNHLDLATLEIPLTPARFKFHKRTTFALVGAACDARLDGLALPRVFAGNAEKDQLLELGPMSSGARIYLALTGGIDVPEMLGSRSTQLREGFGGYQGRALTKEDRLIAGSESIPILPKSGLSLSLPPLRTDQNSDIVIRALPSSEHDSFSEDTLTSFWTQPYTITQQSNRQGYRLEGPLLERTDNAELRSHGIVPGIVQVPGGGQPIIQLADCATMGGYPKIAAVIEQDLWKIGQARAGNTLHFEKINLSTAARAVNEEAAQLAQYRVDIDLMIKQITGRN